VIQVFHLDFLGKEALIQPRDQELHDMAVEFCAKELKGEVNLTNYSHVWVACLVNHEGKRKKVVGITGWSLKVDISLFRSLDPQASLAMGKRINDHLNDSGCRGHEVFLHLSSHESPEQRCANFVDTLKAFKAKPADRWAIEVI